MTVYAAPGTAGAKIACVLVSANSESRRRADAWENEIMRLARLSSIGFEDTVPKASAQIVLEEATVALPLEGVIDFVTSNLRAAPMDTFISGALMESNYPMGPLAGAAFNLTTMSFRGQLNMGLVVDTVAVEEPDRLLTCLKAAYRRLLKA